MAKRYVSGDAETRRNMRELAKYVATPANQAARKALRPMLAAAKRNAKESDETGSLRKSLTVKRQTKSPKLHPRFRVGPDAGYVGPDGRKPVRYAHLINYGKVNSDGSQTPGTRFMDRAFEENAQGTVDIFGKELGPAIEKRAAQLAAKQRKP